MPQDKRLIVTRTIVNQIVKSCDGDKEKAALQGVFLDFILPSVTLQQSTGVSEKIFSLPHPNFPKNGRSTVLIIPKVIGLDCTKINKRHGYYDAVVVAETICRRGDEESANRALQVAKTFSKFVVDARIAKKLPPCILAAVSPPKSEDEKRRSKVLVAIQGMDERESLGYCCSQGHNGVQILTTAHGMCSIRIGHGGMTSGDVCENAKAFILSLKQEYPNLYKFIGEFKLSSSKTESVRFIEAAIQR